METMAFVQNIGMPGLIIIFLVVLVIFGPKSLPALGRSLGRALREFKDATHKMSDALTDDEDEDLESRKPKAKREQIPASEGMAASSTKAGAATGPIVQD